MYVVTDEERKPVYIQGPNALGQVSKSYIYDTLTNGVGEYGLAEVRPPSGPITVADLANSLTNLVFWERNPSLKAKKLTQGSNELAQWNLILKDEVRPALHYHDTQRKISQLIFFSRHPKVFGRWKEQPKDKQLKLSKEFDAIRNNIVQPWLALRLARGKINSRTIFVVDNEIFRSLPWETRTRAGNELSGQFAFVDGNAPITVIFLDPSRFPEEFNFSDAVVSITNLPPNVQLRGALTQQVKNLNRAIGALSSRFRFPAPDPGRLKPDRFGLALMNKLVTPAAQGTPVAAPLMSSAVSLGNLIEYINEEYIPEVYYKRKFRKDEIPKDQTKWSAFHKEIVGIALGRAMAHEVRHMYVRDPEHSADGLGSDGARLFRGDLIKDPVTFSAVDKTSIQSSITTLERQQGTRPIAASFAAAERALDFPF